MNKQIIIIINSQWSSAALRAMALMERWHTQTQEDAKSGISSWLCECQENQNPPVDLLKTSTPSLSDNTTFQIPYGALSLVTIGCINHGRWEPVLPSLVIARCPEWGRAG